MTYLLKPRYWNYFEILFVLKELWNNRYREKIENFFEKEKLKNTIEFFEEYQKVFQEYHQNPLEKVISQKLNELYFCGKNGKFDGKTIYSYAELKTIAKMFFRD